MAKGLLCVLTLWSLLHPAIAQRSLPDSVDITSIAKQSLYATGNEAYRGAAADFQNAWTGKMKSHQQQKVRVLLNQMIAKGYRGNPYFSYFFAYLAFALEQERVNSMELDEILEVNEQAIASLGAREYHNFLYELNTFFSGRILHFARNYSYHTLGGSWKFQNLGAVAEKEVMEEEIDEAAILAQELEFREEFEPAPDDTDWNAVPWGGSNSTMPWDTGFDTGNSWDNPFANDQQEEEAQPHRMDLVSTLPSYASTVKARYSHPNLYGPSIKFTAITILMGTVADTLRISSVNADHLFAKQKLAGSQANINWPEKYSRMSGARVVLGEFTLNMDRGSFTTPNARLSFPSLFSGETEGSFTYTGSSGSAINPASSIQFTSFYSDIACDWDDGRIKYEGGIQLINNQLSGRSLDRANGQLTLLDGKGRTITFRGELFEFGDQIFSSKQTSITILFDGDSVYHPAVEMQFDREKKHLIAYRIKSQNTSPYYSTYHQMAIQLDVLRWDFESDSVNMDVLVGKDLVPATFESLDYYSKSRYNRLVGPFGFHPVTLSVFYARKFGISEFFDQELVIEFNLDERMVKGAMKMLNDNHLAKYDQLSGKVQLLDRAFHYHDAAAKKKDFDNVLISSKVGDKPNATWRLIENEILVRGVNRFYMTTDFKISVVPVNNEMTILRDRSVRFDGEVEAGDFDYKGKDFFFDYGAFLINMPVVDSIRLMLRSREMPGEEGTEQLDNHLTETSGTLFLNKPTNRSAREKVENYPFFVSDSEAIVYFDGPDVLNGAYDKSVRFIVPPVEVDSIDRDDATSLKFPGTFNSGGIFPDFEDTLHILPDRSLGFIHQIPNEGYNLYGTPAKTYEKVFLSSQGIRGYGKIDFLNTTVFSDDFIYYPDSVTTTGYAGVINPGNVGSASFPDATIGAYRMYWLPRKDSMYLKTIRQPFKFYNQSAELIGEANITQKGVYGSGTIKSRGSIATSKEFKFREFDYSAGHALFEVLSDDPTKPAMYGEDISMTFDLVKNVADVHPEKAGVAAISFPYAAMKTSITNAEWFLLDSIITMTKPDNVPIEDSYFYSTREDLDSLAFYATKAIYDIRSYELNVEGIPFITVADAKVVPEGNKTTILANSDLQVFRNAELKFEYPEASHYLKKGVIDVESRNEFSGVASYQLPIMGDTFEIALTNFYQEERILGKNRTEFSTKATGEIRDAASIDIAPGFLYKGGVTFRAFKQALELDGYVKPKFNSQPLHNFWISYARTEDETNILIDTETAKYENGDPVVAGLHFGMDHSLYTTFIETHRTPGDLDFFRAKGIFKFDELSGTYEIEHPKKAANERYAGQTMIYNDSTGQVIFEGLVDFLEPADLIKIKASAMGSGNRNEGNYSADIFAVFNLKLAPTILSKMSLDIMDIVARLGNPPANDIEIESLIKLSNIVGEEITRKYETSTLRGYVPLVSISPELNASMVISGVKMNWHPERRAWYNTTKIGVSNVLRDDVNAKMDGFLEFAKDDAGGDVVHLFLQAAPGTWYYFNYQENSLLVFSSNRAMNEEVAEKSNFGKAKPGEMILIAGDENETLKFLNTFRKNYFGIDEPYNLIYPDDPTLEDESFKTIEKEDDGFGF